MAYNTFNEPRTPTQIDRAETVKVIGTEFGDGYEQTVPDGLNAKRDTLTIRWQNLTHQQAGNIDSFLTSQNALPFWYTIPMIGKRKLFRCTDWSYSSHDLYCDITATFKETFA